LSKTSKPTAGDAMPVRWADVILGTSIPLLVALTSSIALGCAAAPVALMAMFCDNTFCRKQQQLIIHNRNVFILNAYSLMNLIVVVV